MANKKISELTALGVAPASGDFIPIVDISTSVTKSITTANLFDSDLLDQEVAKKVNPLAFSQGIHLTAGATASISVADNANIDFGTGNFTLRWKGSLPDWTPGAATALIHKSAASVGYGLTIHTDNTLRLFYGDGAVVSVYSTLALTLLDGTEHEILAVFTRETATADGLVTFFIDGVQFGAAVVVAAAVPKNVDTTQGLYVLGTDAARYAGTVKAATLFNRALTAAQVLDLYRNGVAFADKSGSQTALYTSDFSAGVDSWVGGDAANQTLTGNIDTNADGAGSPPSDDWMRVTRINSAGRNDCYIDKMTIGKNYKNVASIYNPAGSGISYVKIYAASGQSNTALIISIPEGAETSISDECLKPSVNGRIYILPCDVGGTILSVAQNKYYYIKNVVSYKLGATLDLEPEGIRRDKWYDCSSNNLDASYPTVGWTLTRKPDTGLFQPVPTAETTAVTLTIAKLLTGIITATHAAGATQAYTLPTGALIDAWPAFNIGDSFDWSLINLSAAAADTVTVTAAATGHTIVGNPIVQSAHSSTGGIYGNSSLWRTKKTAAATFVSYRIS